MRRIASTILTITIGMLALPGRAVVTINGAEYSDGYEGDGVSVQVRSVSTNVENSVTTEVSTGGDTPTSGNASALVKVMNRVDGTEQPTSNVEIEVTPDDGSVAIHEERSIIDEDEGTVIPNTVSVETGSSDAIETAVVSDVDGESQASDENDTSIMGAIWANVLSFLSNLFKWL